MTSDLPMQGGAVADRLAHNQEIGGAIPSPATNLPTRWVGAVAGPVSVASASSPTTGTLLSAAPAGVNSHGGNQRDAGLMPPAVADEVARLREFVAGLDAELAELARRERAIWARRFLQLGKRSHCLKAIAELNAAHPLLTAR